MKQRNECGRGVIPAIAMTCEETLARTLKGLTSKFPANPSAYPWANSAIYMARRGYILFRRAALGGGLLGGVPTKIARPKSERLPF